MNEYTEGQVQQFLAEDPRIAELGVRLVRVDDGAVLVGEVESPDRCAQIEAAVRLGSTVLIGPSWGVSRHRRSSAILPAKLRPPPSSDIT